MECSVAFDSSPAALAAYQHTQDLLNNFKRYIAAFNRLVPGGSKSTLWLSNQICAVSRERGEAECNCKTHYQYFFNGIAHYLRGGGSMIQKQTFSIVNLWKERGFIKYLANGTYSMFVSYFFFSSSWSNKWTDHSTSITKIFVVPHLQVAESMPDTKRQRIGLSWRTETALEKKSVQDTSILSEIYIQPSAGGMAHINSNTVRIVIVCSSVNCFPLIVLW